MTTTASDVLTPVPVPLWALLVLVFLLIAATLWAAMPHLMKRAPTRWPFPGPTLNAFTAFLALVGGLLFLVAIGAAFAVLRHTILNALVNPTEGISLGAGSLIAALLGAPFLIWGTVLRHQTVRWQKEGHMTDRISKAVEQLGAEKTVKKDGVEETRPNLEVRIGAILSLERIAQDSTTHDKGRDHVRVMEILCAYIRENAPAEGLDEHLRFQYETVTTKAEEDDPPWTDDEFMERHGIPPYAELSDYISVPAVRGWAMSRKKPKEDIALALKVIGRRTSDQLLVEAAWPKPRTTETTRIFDTGCPSLPDDPGKAPLTGPEIRAYREDLEAWASQIRNYPGYRLDLRGVNLQRADMARGNFQAARLEASRMEGANLVEARLEGASLGEVRMEGAVLGRARMEGADLVGARMEGAYLTEARMEGAYLIDARMEGAFLVGARMEGAYLLRALLEGANLGGARLEGAFLERARLEGADLGGARMEGADLRQARMDQITSLVAAEFQGAAWREIDLKDVRLSLEQVNASFGDASVILPDTLARPAHWPTWELPHYAVNGGPTYASELDRWRADPATYTPPQPPKPRDISGQTLPKP